MQLPMLADKPPLTVVGLASSFIHSQSPDANNLQVLGALWDQFLLRAESVPHRAGNAMYGVIFERPASERGHRG